MTVSRKFLKKTNYKSYDDLPLFLNAELVAQVLGISQAGAYDLLHSVGFSVLKTATRMVGLAFRLGRISLQAMSCGGASAVGRWLATLL